MSSKQRQKKLFLWSFIAIGILFACAATLSAASPYDAVVRAVVRITANDTGGNNIFATGFLVQVANSRKNDQAWLVTVRHILENNSGDSITIGLRRYHGGIFTAQPLQIKIKDRKQQLFCCHPELDLAVIKIALPADIDYCLLAKDFIADDRRFERSSFGAGGRVLVCGYPYGEACNPAGFAFTRNGVVSSYPVTPAALYPYFFVDFEVFAGYSGSPVIYADNTGNLFLAGMALEEVFLEELHSRKNKKTLRTQRGLGLAKALNANIIREFISSLR